MMPVKKGILFVDEEPNVLSGLRRIMHSMNDEWDMSFAGSAHEALTIMDSRSFDVIVSDMRILCTNGTELLNEVKKKHPQTIRIVLSGQTNRDKILRSISPIHQFLSKPCDTETIKKTLTRAFTLRDLLVNDNLKQLVSQIESLPSLPAIYNEIMEALNSKDASTGKVGEIISKDMGMSAKILQLVNSAFFGLPRRLSNPAQAVIYLGLETIKSLVLSVHLFSQFDQNKLNFMSLNTLWQHSMAVAAISKQIIKTEGLGSRIADDAFMAGLLHDVGKLVLASNFSELYKQAVDLAKTGHLSIYEAESEIFGSGHGEVGAYLLGIWGLPDSLILSCAFHHMPMKHKDMSFNSLGVVHAANVFEHDANPNNHFIKKSLIDEDYISMSGLSERIPVWRNLSLEILKEDP